MSSWQILEIGIILLKSEELQVYDLTRNNEEQLLVIGAFDPM